MSTISVEEYFKSDFSFSKEWEKKITTEIDIYRPDLADLRELCQRPISIDFLLTPEMIDEPLSQVHTDEEKELIQTQILQDLNETIEEIKQDQRNIRYKPFTEDVLIQEQWKESKEEYYSRRIFEQNKPCFYSISMLLIPAPRVYVASLETE